MLEHYFRSRLERAVALAPHHAEARRPLEEARRSAGARPRGGGAAASAARPAAGSRPTASPPRASALRAEKNRAR
jgi:hypothetical protein